MLKLKLCAWHDSPGGCKSGDSCGYAHGEHELGQPRPQTGWGGCAAPGYQAHVGLAAEASGLAWGHKTRLCKFWVDGGCDRGDACMFAHGEADLHQKTGGSAPSAYQAPVPLKLKLCAWHDSPGGCKSGDSCGYAHGEHELGQPRPQTGWGGCAAPGYQAHVGLAAEASGLAWGHKTRLCKFWVDGGCDRGDACMFAHGEADLHQKTGGSAPSAYQAPVPLKLKLCAWHDSPGGCKSGDSCGYAHGEHELRQPRRPYLAVRRTRINVSSIVASTGTGTGLA